MMNRNFVKKVMVLAFAGALAVAPAAFAETEAQTEEVTIIGGADAGREPGHAGRGKGIGQNPDAGA